MPVINLTDRFWFPQPEDTHEDWGDAYRSMVELFDQGLWQVRAPVQLAYVDTATLRVDRNQGCYLVVGADPARIELIAESGEQLLNSTHAIDADGVDAGAGSDPASNPSATYYIYRSNTDAGIPSAVRASLVSPSLVWGIKHLGDAAAQRRWRYVGQCTTDGSGLWNSGTLASEYYGDTTNFSTNEVPSGLINGSNKVFTLANTPTPGSEEVYLNGLLQHAGAGNDYTISGDTITFATAPLTGDVVLVSYRF